MDAAVFFGAGSTWIPERISDSQGVTKTKSTCSILSDETGSGSIKDKVSWRLNFARIASKADVAR